MIFVDELISEQFHKPFGQDKPDRFFVELCGGSCYTESIKGDRCEDGGKSYESIAVARKGL